MVSLLCLALLLRQQGQEIEGGERPVRGPVVQSDHEQRTWTAVARRPGLELRPGAGAVEDDGADACWGVFVRIGGAGQKGGPIRLREGAEFVGLARSPAAGTAMARSEDRDTGRWSVRHR